MKPQVLALFGALVTGLLLLTGTATTEARGTLKPGSDAQAVGGHRGHADRLTISLEAPSSASGTLTARVRIEGVSEPYFGFNARIEYEPALLKPTGSENAGLIGSGDSVFCINSAPEEEPGTTFISCMVLGASTVTASGDAATFTFQVLAAGRAQLHLTTFDEGSDTWGAYVMTPGAEPNNPQAMPADTRDATVSVTP